MLNFGLIGKKLDYSFSKTFFTQLFKEKKIEGLYSNIEIDSIEEIKRVFETPDLKGLNVTIPYKESIIPFLDDISEEAKKIGAVNVIQFKEGKKIGYNSDAFGFHQSIKPFLTNQHERALIIGTGGASKAVDYVFKSLGIDTLFISRNPKGDNQFSYEDINVHMLNAYKVIINCTPIGTFPAVDECIPFPFEFLTPNHLVIDLIYNPTKTKFLQKSEKMGATILNGESMLHQQALKAWELWGG